MKSVVKKINNTALGNLLWHVWHYSPSKRKLILLIILSLIAMTIFSLEALVIGSVFNSVQVQENNPVLMKYVLVGLFSLVLLETVSWLFHGVSRWLERKNAFLVRRYYLGEIFRKTLDLPVHWHKKHHSGDTIDKINKAANNLQDFASQLFILIQSVVQVAVAVAVILFFDWRKFVDRKSVV